MYQCLIFYMHVPTLTDNMLRSACINQYRIDCSSYLYLRNLLQAQAKVLMLTGSQAGQDKTSSPLV